MDTAKLITNIFTQLPNIFMNSQITILITGGAGFIGSNLCVHFVEKGYNVVCLDNLSTGYKKNIQDLLLHSNFNYIHGDIRSFSDCKAAVKGVDFVLHHAALGSVPRSINDPITTNDVNITGFLNMITAARDARVKRFIYAASSSTYGDSAALPKVEDVIGNPLSPYAITKYTNELYADIFSKTYGLETIGLRYFNVFGKNQDPNGAYAAVIPKFISQFIKHISPTVNGDGSNSRDFTFIENVIHINDLAIETNNASATNTVYNTAFGKSTTINVLIDSIKSELSIFDEAIAHIPVLYADNRAGDIPHSLASIDKATQLLGYKPKFSLEQGLQKTAKWYWNNLK